MASPTKRSWTPVVKETLNYVEWNNITKKLLEAVGVSPGELKENEFEGYADRLREAKSWYHVCEVQENKPSPNEKRAALEEVFNKAHAFVVSMLELDEDSKSYLRFKLEGAIRREGTFSVYDQAWNYTGRVEQAASDAINILPKSNRGPRKSTAQVNLMVYHLLPIYKNLVNKDPFETGPKELETQFLDFLETGSKESKAQFLDFTLNFLKVIERPAQSRRALITAQSRAKQILSKKHS